MNSADRHLRGAMRRAKRLTFDAESKLILMSDCHRGQGNNTDDFLRNQALFFGAMDHYYREGFTYIELGDGDELWENRRLPPIIESHDDAFWMLSRFYKKDRFHMLYGNHDIIKRRKNYMGQNCSSFYCDASGSREPLFPGLKIEEAIVLENTDICKRILLVHGHQGSFLNDRCWRLARFLVRYVWRPLELVGFLSPTGAARSHRQKEKIEKNMARFAKNEQILVVAGHTHRPVFPAPGESLYLNDGSCVHPRCITGIEIENNALCLIKWSVSVRKDSSLCVSRAILEGPVEIEKFFP